MRTQGTCLCAHASSTTPSQSGHRVASMLVCMHTCRKLPERPLRCSRALPAFAGPARPLLCQASGECVQARAPEGVRARAAVVCTPHTQLRVVALLGHPGVKRPPQVLEPIVLELISAPDTCAACLHIPKCAFHTHSKPRLARTPPLAGWACPSGSSAFRTCTTHKQTPLCTEDAAPSALLRAASCCRTGVCERRGGAH